MYNRCVCLFVLAEMCYSTVLPPYTWACTDVICSDILENGGRRSGNIIEGLNKTQRYVLFCRVKWRMSSGFFQIFALSFFHKYLLCLPLLKMIECMLYVCCGCFVSPITKEMYCCKSPQVSVHLKLHFQCKRMCRSSLKGCLQFIIKNNFFFWLQTDESPNGAVRWRLL